MARKRFTAEQIIIKLREAEVGLAQGKTVGQVCKQIGVSYYRWRKEYNQRRTHSALAYRSPAPEARSPGSAFYPMEWTSNGPRSNLESGLVPGGRSKGCRTVPLCNPSRWRFPFGVRLICPQI